MARQLNPDEKFVVFQHYKLESEAFTDGEQESWLQRIEARRAAILSLTPELKAWFGEQFTAPAQL